MHIGFFQEMCSSKEIIKKEKKPTAGTVTVAQHFPVVSRKNASSTGKSTKKTLVQIIADFIIEDMQPMSIVEKTGFRKLLEELKPGFLVPDRRAVVSTIEVSLNCLSLHVFL